MRGAALKQYDQDEPCLSCAFRQVSRCAAACDSQQERGDCLCHAYKPARGGKQAEHNALVGGKHHHGKQEQHECCHLWGLRF